MLYKSLMDSGDKSSLGILVGLVPGSSLIPKSVMLKPVIYNSVVFAYNLSTPSYVL